MKGTATLLVRVQPGRDEQPQLPHDRRRRDHDAREQRHLQLSMKASVGSVETRLEPAGSMPCSGSMMKVEDPVDEEERDDQADGERSEGETRRRELVEVLQKRHLAGVVVAASSSGAVGQRGRWRADLARGRGPESGTSELRAASAVPARAGGGIGGRVAGAWSTGWPPSRRSGSAPRLGFPLRGCSQLVRRPLELGELLPSDRPSSGSLRGPKMIRAMTR